MLTVLAGFAISATLSTPKKYIVLSDLSKYKEYKTSISYNPKGCHYLFPMLLNVTNPTTEDIYIIVKTGDIYNPSDPTCQDILTTKSDTIYVKANETKLKPIAGMCIEPSDHGGRDKINYVYQKTANEKLKQIAEYISLKNYQSSAAQEAVWGLAKNQNDYFIYSNNKAELLGLNRVMEKITGHKPKTEQEMQASSAAYYSPPVYTNKYWGEFDFKQNNETNLKLGLFNKRGIQVRELYNNPTHPKGISKVSFAFDMAQYTDSTYLLILVKNQEIVSRTVLNPYN